MRGIVIFFAQSGVDTPPLSSLANGVDGPNGVYAKRGPSGTFPRFDLSYHQLLGGCRLHFVKHIHKQYFRNFISGFGGAGDTVA